jgi:hypothetical protein
MQQNESTIVQFDGLTREQVLCALYNASKPQGLGFFHYDPMPLKIDEAKNVLSKSDFVDYLKGRVIKVNLPKEAKEFDARLYDRDCGAGAARAAIERYK